MISRSCCNVSGADVNTQLQIIIYLYIVPLPLVDEQKIEYNHNTEYDPVPSEYLEIVFSYVVHQEAYYYD